MCTLTSIHACSNGVMLVMRRSASLLYYFAALLDIVLDVTVFKWAVLTGFIFLSGVLCQLHAHHGQHFASWKVWFTKEGTG